MLWEIATHSAWRAFLALMILGLSLKEFVPSKGLYQFNDLLLLLGGETSQFVTEITGGDNYHRA